MRMTIKKTSKTMSKPKMECGGMPKKMEMGGKPPKKGLLGLFSGKKQNPKRKAPTGSKSFTGGALNITLDERKYGKTTGKAPIAVRKNVEVSKVKKFDTGKQKKTVPKFDALSKSKNVRNL